MSELWGMGVGRSGTWVLAATVVSYVLLLMIDEWDDWRGRVVEALASIAILAWVFGFCSFIAALWRVTG